MMSFIVKSMNRKIGHFEHDMKGRKFVRPTLSFIVMSMMKR